MREDETLETGELSADTEYVESESDSDRHYAYMKSRYARALNSYLSGESIITRDVLANYVSALLRIDSRRGENLLAERLDYGSVPIPIQRLIFQKAEGAIKLMALAVFPSAAKWSNFTKIEIEILRYLYDAGGSATREDIHSHLLEIGATNSDYVEFKIKKWVKNFTLHYENGLYHI